MDTLNQRWYVQVDDVVGGWILANVDKPLSELDYRKGEHEVGTFVQEEVAEHIAAEHNKRLGSTQPSAPQSPLFRAPHVEPRAGEG